MSRNLLVGSLRRAFLFSITFVLLAHSVKAATPIDALKFWKNYFITGDYVVGGVGLRGKGVRDASLNLSLANGEINIGDTTVPNGSSPIPVTNGVPGDIIAAFLYWQTDEPASATKPSAWLGYFDGQQVIGDVVGDPNNLSCEQGTTKFGRLYRADVLRYLAIDRTNNVRIGNGKHSIRLRDDGPNGPFFTNGASLVLIYRTVVPGSPTAVKFKSVVIYDGPYNQTKKAKLEQVVGGFYQADQTTPNYSLATRMSIIVGNGQPGYAENLNVTTSIGPGAFADPFRGLAGARWDNPTFNIFLKKNDSSYAMQMTSDAPVCLTVGVLVTSVPVVDTDRDGLLDVWETKGMHLNKQASPATFGGCSDYPNEADKCVNLPGMGANAAKQDIFIETDWFKGTDHEHALKLAAVNELGAAYARHNIALHVDAGNKLLDSSGKPLSQYIIPASFGKGGEVINESDLLCSTVNAAIKRNIKPGSVLDELQKQGKLGDLGCTFPDADLGYPALSYKRGFLFVKNGFPLANLPAHFDVLRKDIFHYLFSAHAMATFDQEGKPTKDPVTGKVVPLSVSGVADKPGADIMLTLGLWRSDVLADDKTGSATQQGGTIMHELGHNLGLSHAGLLRTPACMSNYQSSMNYQYQTRGMSDAQGKAHPDFSNGLLRPTTEGTLSEDPASLGTLPYRVRFYGPQTLPGEGTAKGHCDGTPITDGALAVRAENRDLSTLDWNRNGKRDSQTVLFDANFDGVVPQSSSNAQSFVDSNDWASLNLQQVGARLNTNGLSVSIGSLDIGSLDIGSLDIGSLDIGSLDIGSLDIGSLYGSLDIGSLDIGSLDIGSLDIGSLDIGSLDIGSLDIGSLDIGERDFDSEIRSGIDPIDPAQPLTATNNRTNNVDFITLNWGASTLGQIQRYKIFRARGTNPLAQDFAQLATVERNGTTPPATTYNDQVNDFVNSGSDCPNPQSTCYNTTYTYYIVAVEASNLVESGASNQASSKMTHLFVIADDKSVMYGNPLPVTTFKIFGEVLGTLSGVSCVYSPAAPRNAGNYPIVCSGPSETSPKDGVTYNAPYRDSTGLHSAGTLTITPAPLTLTATTNTKTYDANTSAAAIPTPAGLKYNDTAVPTVETYDTKDVGTGKTLSVTGYTINDGNGGNNYIVTTAPDNTGVVQRKQLTPSVTAANKAWDGTTTATITSCSLSGVVMGETVTCSVAGANFSDANIGTNKTVTATGITIDPGPYSANYILSTTTAVTTANIFDGTPPVVTLTIPAPNGGAGYFKTSPVLVGVSAHDQFSNVSSFACTDNAAPIAVGSLTGIGTPTASGTLSVTGDGTHDLTCTSTDSVSNSGAAPGSTNSGSLKIDATAPNVAIVTPVNGAPVTGTISLTATASDGLSGVVQVQYLVDGNAVGTSTTAPDYAFSWNSTLVADGAHVITAIASDAAGNTKTSAAVNVTVTNNADLSVAVTIIPGAFPRALTSGGVMSYSVVVTNQGSLSAANVNVTDTLPAGLTSVTCVASVGTCLVNGVNVAASLGALAPAANATVTIAAFAPTTGSPITINNLASASTSSPETNTANNQVSTGIIVSPVAGPPGALVLGFDFDPSDPNIVYAATDSAGVFKSFDGGGHWITFLPFILTARSVIANGNTVHVGSSFGVLTTRNAGATWTTNATVNGVFAMAMDPTNNAVLYAGRSGSPTLFKSTDSGATWVGAGSGLPASAVNAIAIDKNTPSIVYAGTQSSGMYKSTDSGITFVQINTGGLAGLTVLAIAIDPSNSNTVYAGTATGIFKSTDGGNNWAPVNTSLSNTQTFGLAIDRTAPGTIYAATAGGVFKSTNGAANWAFASSGVTNPQTRAIAIDPISTNTLYLGTGYGVFKTTNAAGNWSESSAGLAGMIVAALLSDPTHPGTVYAASSSLAGIMRSPDSGTSWARTSNNISLNLTGLALDPAGILYAASPSLGMYRSITGGANWISINTGLTNQNVRSIALDTLNPATLYIGTTNGGLFKTTNNGTNWNLSNSSISASFPVAALAIDRTNGAIVYAGSGGAGMYKSTDGGTTWTPINTGLTNLNVTALAIDPSNNNNQTIYAGTAGGVFKSTNAGGTWTAMNTGLQALTVTALAIDPSNPSTLYVGTNLSLAAQIFKSTDGAATWAPASAGMANPIVRTFAFDSANSSTIFAGTAGGGVFKSSDGGATWVSVGLGLVPLPPQLQITLSERPNPVVGAGTVGFEITVTNIGGAPADNAIVTFNIPPGMTFVSCGSIINGALAFACNLNGSTVTFMLGTVFAGATDIVGVTASVPAPVNQTFINTGASVSTVSSQMSTLSNQNSFVVALNPLSGPPSGQVLSLAVHPTNSNTVLAGTNGGGIFRTTNGGSTWTPVNASLSGFFVRGIAIHPLNPNLVYLATNNGTWISLDGANSWLGFDDGINGAAVFSVAVDPTDVNVAYAGTSTGGIFKTTNQALLWTPVNNGLTTTFIINSIVVDSSSPNTVYAASEGAGVFKTTNGGALWTAVNTNLTTLDVRALAIDPTNSATIYAATNGGGVFKSTNGGGSWTAINTGLITTSVHQALLIDKTNSQIVYVGAGGVFKSTNGGSSWTSINSGMTNPNALASANVAALAADPSNTASIYAGTNPGVFKTTDAGNTWNAMSTGINAASVNSLTVDPANPSIIYAGANGDSWYKSVNGGATWSATNNGGLFSAGIGGFAVNPRNNAELYAGRSGGGGPYKSTNGGISWTFIGNGDLGGVLSGITAYVIDPFNTATVYAGGQTVTSTTNPTVAGVFKTTNGGSTWATMNTGLTNTNVRALVSHSSAPATLYAGTFGGGVFKSTDGAANWTLFSSGITNPNVTSLAIDRLAPNTLYAGTLGGGIFKTTDGGTSWAPMNSGLVNPNVQVVVVDPTNSNLVYTGTSGGFAKSVNGGASWIFANTGLSNVNILSLSIDPATPTRLYAGTGGGGVFKSIDSGNTWQPVGATLVPFATPASIAVSSGSGQATTVNTTFPATLQALVKDAGNNPVIGTPVTFTAPAAGASGGFPGGVQTFTVATNNSGIAIAPAFTANGQTGTYNVTASAVGVGAAANFSLTNTP